MKRCIKCGQIKELDQFYVHKQMADGYLNVCKECVKKRVTNHYQQDIESNRAKERERNKKRQSDPRYKEIQKKANKKYREKSNIHCYRTLYKNKPDRCSNCQTVTEKLHAHHPDYNKPLDVIWLCVPCHRQLHLVV